MNICAVDGCFRSLMTPLVFTQLFKAAHIVVFTKLMTHTHSNVIYCFLIVDIFARLQDATNCLPFQIAKVCCGVNFFTQNAFTVKNCFSWYFGYLICFQSYVTVSEIFFRLNSLSLGDYLAVYYLYTCYC